MHPITHLISTLTFICSVVVAANNEPCYGPDGTAGVCIADTACSGGGGTSIAGACPADASNIKCCSKPTCDNGGSGNCRWSSDCAGESIANQCPGPSQMKCCSSAEDGFGGYDTPALPEVGGCKQVAVNGAQKIIEAFPGSVREIGCTRDCACPGDSDHCCGLATDMMCSDAASVGRSLELDGATKANNCSKCSLLHSLERKLQSG